MRGYVLKDLETGIEYRANTYNGIMAWKRKVEQMKGRKFPHRKWEETLSHTDTDEGELETEVTLQERLTRLEARVEELENKSETSLE